MTLSTTPTISINDDGTRIILNTQYHQKDLAKAVPGSRWNPNEQHWHAPLSWGVLWSLRAVFGNRIEADESVRAWVSTYVQERVTPLEQYRELLDMDGDDDLMPFQRAGVEFMLISRNTLLADEMGTGKTIQAIETVRRLGNTPVLIICPNSMKLQWQEELLKWWPDATSVVVEGNITQRRKQIKSVEDGEVQVLIINWEALRGHSRLAAYGSIALNRCTEHGGDAKPNSCEVHDKELNSIIWGVVIADEAHRMKNPKAKQSRAAWRLAHQQDCPRYALTGTPIANHPGELWSLLHFLSPADWPSKVKYVDLYCLTGWNPWGGSEILDINPVRREYFDRIFLPMFLRRPKSLVLPQLPAKAYQTRHVQMTPKQRKAYKELRDEFITELEGGIAFVTNPLVKMVRLLQLCSSYMDVEVVDDKRVWSMTTPSAKVNDLVEFIEDAEDQRVVVFAESKQLINLAASALLKAKVDYVTVTGDIHPAERQVAVKEFQDGNKQVILLTLGVGGEGITLTNADVVFFMERSWSMVKNKQAEDRIHRIGLEHPVLVVDQITPDTVEEYRLEALTDKDAKLENLVRDEDLLRRVLNV